MNEILWGLIVGLIIIIVRLMVELENQNVTKVDDTKNGGDGSNDDD